MTVKAVYTFRKKREEDRILVDENIRDIDSMELVSDAYVGLSRYVAKTRVYPSIKDGLKTVYRRLIYSNRNVNKFTKAVSGIGECIKYHAHGDSSIAGALVNLTCPYNNLAVFEGKGNWGGMGFSASSPRYLEFKVSPIGRYIYMDYIDQADYELSETGFNEPSYIPSMLPFAFIEGSTGISVGLPNPRIPALNILELIDYYISLLSDETPKVPLPNYGDLIIDGTEEDIRSKVEKGSGSLRFKSVLYRESSDTVVIRQLPPQLYIERVLRNLDNYIESDDLEFIDESSSDYRYVFRINNMSLYSEIYDAIDHYSSSSFSLAYYFENDGTVVSSSFDYIIKESLKYYKECVIRYYQSKLDSELDKQEVIKVLVYLRENEYLSNITNYTKEDIVNELKGKFEEGTINKALAKSLSYLTRTEFQTEISNIEDSIKDINYTLDNMDSFLIDRYNNLKKLYLESYGDREYSRLASEVSESSISKILYYIDTNKISKTETDHAIFDNSKYVIIVFRGKWVYVQDISELSEDQELFRSWEDDSLEGTIEVYHSNSDNISVELSNGDVIDYDINSLIKSRLSYPTKVANYSYVVTNIRDLEG